MAIPCKLAKRRGSATAVVRYTAAALSDRGRKRPLNEDAFGFSVEHGVYVVCDGMGGAAAGKLPAPLPWMRFFATSRRVRPACPCPNWPRRPYAPQTMRFIRAPSATSA